MAGRDIRLEGGRADRLDGAWSDMFSTQDGARSSPDMPAQTQFSLTSRAIAAK
jgi:hypothetical protein